MSNHTDHYLSNSRRIAVVGGGISGLAATFYLDKYFREQKTENAQKQDRPSICLYESSSRLGGVIKTDRHEGFLVEQSADSFIANQQAPWAEQFCHDLGVEQELIPTNSENRRAEIWFNGRLHRVPEGFQLMKPSSMWPIAKSSLLSPWGKARLAYERFVPKRTDETDESFASFAIRRLGQEAFERLVQPLVSGIYTADPQKLSMQAALPQFVKMEREHGSLIRAALAQKREKSSGARYNQFWSFRNGLEQMVQAVQAKLSDVDIKLESPVASVQHEQDGWSVKSNRETRTFDAIVLALPVRHSATLVQTVDSELQSQLQRVEHASSAVVCVGYRREQLRKPLSAFGCVLPEVAKRKVLAVSYSSMKFPGRAPDGCELFRVFIGGALHPELAALPDDELLRLVRSELNLIFGVQGEPTFCKIARWLETMPQYHVGHQALVQQIDDRVQQHPGLELAGNGLNGVGLPQCIRSGMEASEAVLNFLTQGKNNDHRSSSRS